MLNLLEGLSLLAVITTACGLFTGPDDPGPLQPTPTEQFFIVGDPQVALHPDSALVVVRVTIADSNPHVRWVPTRVLLETDQGYRAEQLMAPWACLEPGDPEASFPFNFQWFSCRVIGINTRAVLTPSQVREVETTISGDSLWAMVFQARSGAQYLFTVPVGRESTTEAVTRAGDFNFVNEAYKLGSSPLCVISDAIPPPPCPPWGLRLVMPFSPVSASPDTLFVGSAGWVRVTYVQPDGSTRTARLTFD